MTLDVFSTDTNMAIVRPPGRRFPGIVIQGDNLWALREHAKVVRDRLRVLSITDDEIRDGAEALFNDLDTRVKAYEKVLEAHGIPIPYFKQ